ncbi:hypothetical protein WA026_017143 [Henosepilachna vigintioctopunctata]|uniref:Rho guanine nucleotide exchange factor 7 n=1 Tax=Henosepilachna vigintioctopunctata TaxID=420089 RepID=A0AAW1TV94_9CUCU
MASEPLVVKAIFSFKGTNNDELCFKKGDIITVTQKDEGWWEGTLNGKTGWFPSNYIHECIDAPKPKTQSNQYKSVVLRDLIDSEKAHVTELKGLVTNFLQPLEKNSILTPDEYKQLTGNIIEVLDTHQALLSFLENEERLPGNDQKVGKLFLNWAPKIKSVHQKYCSLHPRAVCILDKYKDELTKYMESKGASSPGVLVLTTMMSKPFRRLEKYAGMLQELERHIEEFHPDRGDTQRSVAIFKDLAATCAATRRQKELELQVLTGPIRNWEGPSLMTLGEILYMGSVAVGPQHNDKYFVMFPTCLLILSVSHRLSAFIYEGQLPLSGLSVTRLPDTEQYKNAFEISSSMIEKKIAVCQSKDEANYWVDLLKKQLPKTSSTTDISTKVSPSQAHFVPQPPPHMSPLVAASNIVNRQIGKTNSSQTQTSPSHGNVSTVRNWSPSCLRPSPPLRLCLTRGSTVNGLYNRSHNKHFSFNEDSLILDVINAYCVVKPRNTINSVNLLNGTKLDPNRTLLESIQQLQSKVNILECNVATLSTQLQEERSARCNLQTVVKNFLHPNTKDCELPIIESNL